MVSYNSSEVVQCLRQYEMFANSLKLINNLDERNMIVKQLTKLENRIIALTGEVYNEEYNALINKECRLLDEEENRLIALIELINQRLSYVEKRCNNHYALTGESIDALDVLGADALDSFENKARIIDKYKKNIRLKEELEADIKTLSNKVSLANEKIEINKSLNEQLEHTFKETLDDAFQRLDLLTLLDVRDDVEYAYYETEKSLRLAESNLEVAKTGSLGILSDGEEMLRQVSEDYDKYRDQISIIKLIEINEQTVNSYDELVAKRRRVNEILKYVKNQDLLDMIVDMVTKQFSTILMEQQDVNTFNDLAIERERKLEAIAEIDSENNSEEFKSVLTDLIANERKRKEKMLEEQRKIEEMEKQKRLEIQRKKQEEVLKRQRIIEEARKKEIERRTKKLLEEQNNSILQGKKKEKELSETIGNDENVTVNHQEEKEPVEVALTRESFQAIKLESNKIDDKQVVTKKTIEEDLFAEFNSKSSDGDSSLNVDDLFSRLDEKMPDNKFPDMSFDEYMTNFSEDKIEKTDTLFDDTSFPSIPL